MTLHDTRSERIGRLNDYARYSLTGCMLLLTPGIMRMEPEERELVIAKVRNFSQFTPKMDPRGEHDFGEFDHGGQRVFWKFEYQDKRSVVRIADPVDDRFTQRLLTILLAEEY